MISSIYRTLASLDRGIETPLRAADRVELVERIADGIDLYLHHAFGVTVTPVPVDTTGADPEVRYTDQEEQYVREALRSMGKRLPDEED